MISSPQIADNSCPPEVAGKCSAGPLYRTCKRAIDLVVSGSVIVFLSPLWVLIALLIKLDSPGPVFFSQRAVGRNETEFTLLKFRSMIPNSQTEEHVRDVERNFYRAEPTATDKDGRPIFKTALSSKNRVTRVGRWLRRISLDEAPQFWNILCSDMSLVGPRPSLPHEARLYESWQKQRFLVKPGLTGLYQVTARNRVPIQEMIRIDIDYVRDQSFTLDLYILTHTPAAMFRGL